MARQRIKPRPKPHRPTADELEDSELFAYVTNRWSRTVVQPLLIALVVSAFFTAVAVVIDTLFRITLFTALAPFLFLAALEGIYTSIWLNHPNRRQLNTLAYRAAEFLIIVLLLRLYTWVVAANYPQLAQFTDYLKYPLLLFTDLYFLLSVVLVLLNWMRTIAASRTFMELSIDRAEAFYFTRSPAEQDPGMKPAISNRGEIVGDIFRQWIIGGMVLAGATAVVAIEPLEIFKRGTLLPIGQLNLPISMILSLLVYFVAGLLLLSQARLGALNARWLHEGVIKTADVERTWHRATTWLLLAIATIALFLPLGSTFAIGAILEMMLNTILGLFTVVITLVITLLSLFFAPLNRDLPAITPPPMPTPILPTAVPTPLATSTAPPSETPQLLFSSAFWAVAIVMSIIAISFFLRDRGIRLNLPLLKRISNSFLAWLRSLWQDATDYAEDFRQSIRDRLQTNAPKEEPPAQPPWRFIRLNALSPRDQIRYFYLSAVKRASEQGIPRADGETPIEFAADLKSSYPEAEAEIEELTEAFLRARYSPEEIEKEDVSPVKRQWQQVKSRLRKQSPH